MFACEDGLYLAPRRAYTIAVVGYVNGKGPMQLRLIILSGVSR